MSRARSITAGLLVALCASAAPAAAEDAAVGASPYAPTAQRTLDPSGRLVFRVCPTLHGLLERLDREDVGCVQADGSLRLQMPDVGTIALRLDVPADEGKREAVRLVDDLLLETGAPLGPTGSDGEIVLGAALLWSERLELDPEGRFRDVLTGRDLDFPEAYAVFVSETPGKPRVLRTAVESAGLLGAYSIWYWTAAAINKKDWEYFTLSEALEAKFVTLQAWRFDDNRIHLNVPGHVLAGAGYYVLARSNGLGAPGSFASAFLGSLAWELLIEYRELVGINDLVVGSFGSAAVGEAFYQIGELFVWSRRTPVTSVLAAIFGAPQELHRAMDGRPPPIAPEVDAGGLPADRFHRLELALGPAFSVERVSSVPGSLTVGELRVQALGEVYLLPEYRHEVAVRRFVSKPSRTLLDLAVYFGQDGASEVDGRANVVLLAWHDQDIGADARGRVGGYSLLLGLATDYREKERWRTPYLDTYGSVGLLGPVLDLTLLSGAWDARLQAEVYPDFALVSSRALPQWSLTHSLEGTKSVLREQGYYFALGASGLAGLRLRRGPFELGGDLWVHRFDSIEGLDRKQAEVTNDFHLVDGERVGRVWVVADLPLPDSRLYVGFEDRSRWGRIGDVTVEERDRRFSGGLSWRF